MNPAKVSIQLLDINNLTHQQIFKLAHLIDAYEIDKQLQDKLVIDILKVTRSGRVELILTPKTGLKYDELSEHLDLILKYALTSSDMDKCRWEIIDIDFITQKPGKPSYIHEEGIHTAFRTE
jgi:hypothetical protein